MCAFGVLGLSCASPGGPVWWGRRGFTRQPERPNVHIFLVGKTEETSFVKSHELTIRTGLRLSRVPVVPEHLLRGRNHVTSAWRGATVEM